MKLATHITLGEFLYNPLDVPDLIALPCMTVPSMSVSVCVGGYGGVCRDVSLCLWLQMSVESEHGLLTNLIIYAKVILSKVSVYSHHEG